MSLLLLFQPSSAEVVQPPQQGGGGGSWWDRPKPRIEAQSKPRRDYAYLPTGGLSFSGTAKTGHTVLYAFLPSGGIELFGSATATWAINRHYFALAGVAFGGEAKSEFNPSMRNRNDEELLALWVARAK